MLHCEHNQLLVLRGAFVQLSPPQYLDINLPNRDQGAGVV